MAGRQCQTVVQAGHDLVQRIVGRPDLRVLRILLQKVELLFGISAQETGTVAFLPLESLLADPKLAYHVVDLLQNPLIAGRRVGQSQSGQVMTGRMTLQLAFIRIPAGHRFRALRGKSGCRAEIIEHLIVVLCQQELHHTLLRLGVRSSFRQTHTVHRDIFQLLFRCGCFSGH